MYIVDLNEKAIEDIEKHRKSGDKQALKKVKQLIDELEIHPKTGNGKPKPLTGYNGIRWSRRITDIHRLVYDIFEFEKIVEITQAWGHYEDK